MLNVELLPTLDIEAGAPGSMRHQPVVAGQVIAGVILGIVIAVSN